MNNLKKILLSKKITRYFYKKNISANNLLMLIILILIILMLQIIVPFVYAISITEIMFNPQGADTGREWMEIWLNESDGCINFTEYRLFEDNTNHHIYSYNNDYACEYTIIYADVNKFLQDYEYLNDSYYPLYKSAFSLNNEGEILSIKKDDTILFEINYTQIIDNITVFEGYSLEYKNNTWRNSELLGGDPGNIIEEALKNLNENNTEYNITNNNTTEYNTTNNINITNTINNTISINITNINITDSNNINNSTYNNNTINATIEDSINVTSNNTPNITINTTSNNITNDSSSNNNNTNNTCHASINILIKNETIIYENNVPLKFYNIIEIEYNNTNITKKEINYSIEYWIEDLSGTLLKNNVITINQNEKTFTPDISEKDQILKIKNILKDINCNIIKNSSEKIILIKNSAYKDVYTNAETVCPKCESINTKCEEQTLKSNVFFQHYNNSEITGIKPAIKIINICDKINNSINNNSNLSIRLLANSSTNNYGLRDDTESNVVNTLKDKNASQSTSRATSMIIYESDNLKNRFYAIIGLVLVVLTSSILLVRKIYIKYFKKNIIA